MDYTFDLITHIRRQREFSERTFGPGPRTAGVIDHIRKELAEIEAKPDDILEWVDVILLALDGAWRAGWEPNEIAAAINAKQLRNEKRDWPDWRTAEPGKAIEHVRSDGQGESIGRPVKPHRSGGLFVMRSDYDKCPYCDARRPVLSGPNDPRPYVCLEHRHLAHQLNASQEVA